METERLPEGRPARGLRAKLLPESSEAEKVPFEARLKVWVELRPVGLPLKRDVGILIVVDQLFVGVNSCVVFSGEQEVCGEVLPARLVTAPGARGVFLVLWLGGAGAADTGTKNRKLGSSRKGTRAAAACFLVIPAPIGYEFSIYNGHRRHAPAGEC